MNYISQKFQEYIAVFFAILGICLSFMVSQYLTKVNVAEEPIDYPSLEVDCSGKWNDVVMTQDQLDDVVEKHGQWLKENSMGRLLESNIHSPYESVIAYPLDKTQHLPGTATPLPPNVVSSGWTKISNNGRADLCGARIINLDFKGADLRYARFMGARIERSNMGGMDLRYTHMVRVGMLDISSKDGSFSTISRSNLIGALIYDSDFSRWDFEETDISYSDVGNVNFSNAQFDRANFSGASLRNINFKDAELTLVNFNHTLLNIRPGYLPQITSLRDAKNLTSLKMYGGGEGSWEQVKNEMNKYGLRLPAAEINYAINSQRNMAEIGQKKDRNYPLQASINQILFGIPYAYAVKPQRLFCTALFLIGFLTLFYLYCILHKFSDGRSGIYLIARSVDENIESVCSQLHTSNCNPIKTALYFSILSAFRIGWGSLSVGEWIARLQHWQYEYKSLGWPRVISGLQSLLSVYLLALAVASYFVL